ncbi:MAG: holo-ACP synthase [Patescibacteria group bacterium]
MIGVDIISIERFAKIGEGDYKHWSKFFSRREWKYAFGKPDPHRSLAGIYAAKEAVMKAVGGKVMERADRIEITHAPDGKPLAKIDKEESRAVHVSISHTNDIAVAVAIQYE